MALFSNKRNIKRAKEAAGQIQAASIRGMEIADTEKARSIAAEETKFNVLTALGAPGTYGPGAPGVSGTGGGGGGIFNTSGGGLSEKDQSLKAFGNWGGGDQLKGAREGIIDPNAYTAKLSQSSIFRQQSQQVAESEQLLNREGPLWDRLENSVLGTIHEGAALQLRDATRRLRNDMAKGGTARRTALNEARQMIVDQNAMSMRVKQTWEANIRLNEYVQQNFERVRDGSMKFTDALPGLNDAYRTSMNNTALMAIDATKAAAAMAGEAYDLRMSQQAVNFGTKLAEGLIQAVASAIPGVGPVLGSAIGYAGSAT
ncbi:hypothetical protein LCGC14_2623050, partial [marine sediment metagenome]